MNCAYSDIKKIKAQESFFAFILIFLKNHKFHFFLFCLLSLLAGCFGPFNGMLLRLITNELISNHSLFTIAILSILIVLNFFIFDNVTWRGIAYVKCLFLPKILFQIYKSILDYVLSHPYKYFQERQVGKLNKEIFNLTSAVEAIMSECIPHFLRMISLILFAFFLSFSINFYFSLIFAFWTFCFFFFSFLKTKKLIFLSEVYAQTESELGGKISDILSNFFIVNLFATKDYEINFLNKHLIRVENAYFQKEFSALKVHIIQGLLIGIMIIINLSLLMYFYNLKMINTGDFILIFNLSLEIGYMMWWTMAVVEKCIKELGKAGESLSELLLPILIEENNNRKELIVTSPVISFEHVSFSYNAKKIIFQDMSVLIPAKQKIGLVGYSGGGKTTFVNLILRIYEIQKGKILIDNQVISEVTQDSLHKSISMISQDPFLFHRSLIENIRYGSFDRTDDEVIIASKKAYIYDFISSLPDGYATIVGERGLKLSGGQRQRIAIARAFLKNAPILILDEATSALDSITEKLIEKSLIELMQDKTTIIIAHRLSTLKGVDRILVFDEGEIVQDGSHEELITGEGLYKKLWETQINGHVSDFA